MATITVLMPVWRGERPDWFAGALHSATVGQTRHPDELVVAVDGPLTPELEAVVKDVEAGEYGDAKVTRSDEHRGVAATLQMGLGVSGGDYIARADSDDHYRPERLQKQLGVMESGGLDLLGTAMQEFSGEHDLGQGKLRMRPCTHAQIWTYLPKHTPFHHPTVMFRRQAALDAGGYLELDRMEDYWLWQRMLAAGAKTANLPEPLVDYRVTEDLFDRRGGLQMFRSDLHLQRVMLNDGMIRRPRYAYNLALRAGYRFCPVPLRRLGYRLFVEERRHRREA
jgi:glycosyltransferase involved in cell wall biosynthesis